MLSAFLMYKHGKGKERNYIDLVRKRFVSLIIPYFIYNTFAYAFVLVKEILETRSIEAIWQLISFEKLFRNIFLKESNQPMWFIPILFCFALLYPIILKLVECRKNTLGIIIALIAINIWRGVNIGYSTVRYWLPIYLLGAMLGYHNGDKILISKHLLKKKQFYLVPLILLLVIVQIAELDEIIYYLYRHIYPILLYLCIDFFSPRKKPLWLYECSFFIYGTHIMVIGPILKIYFYLLGYGKVQGILSNLVIPLSNVAIILCVAYIMKRFFPKLWKVINGGRAV